MTDEGPSSGKDRQVAVSDRLLLHLDEPGIDGNPDLDIIKLQPDLSLDDALRLQLAAKRRRVADGDRIVGHQASFTSAGIRTMFPDAPRPMIGTLLASLMRQDGDLVELDCESAFIESELGLVLKRDIEGPAVTRAEVLAAIEGFVPAIEVAPLRPGALERKYSYQHMIAVQKAKGGYIVVGNRITAPHAIDPRLEGCVISIDGEARAGAVGFEAMGNPLDVVVAMARGLAAIGEKLCAGQLVITGSLPPPQVINRETREARLEFHTLGSVCVRFPGQ